LGDPSGYKKLDLDLYKKVQHHFRSVLNPEILKTSKNELLSPQNKQVLGELAKVHRTYVGMIERGEKNITLINIEKFAKALKVSIQDLFRNLTIFTKITYDGTMIHNV